MSEELLDGLFSLNRATNGQPPPQNGQKVRKRKNTDDGDAASSSKKAADKRAKTPRACDSCRRKKIRCEVVQEDPPLCKHCKGHTSDCTWFLPITETRWKKTGKPPTQSEQAAALAAGTGDRVNKALEAVSSSNNNDSDSARSPDFTYAMAIPSRSALASLSPVAVHSPLNSGTSLNSPLPLSHSSALPLPAHTSSASNAGYLSPAPLSNARDPRLLGPTSISHIMHSTAVFPVEHVAAYNNKYCHSWDVKETGDGFIKIYQNIIPSGASLPSVSAGNVNSIDFIDESQITPLSAATIEALVNAYFNIQAPLFPVLSRADFLVTSPLEPLLLWSICGVAAMTARAPSYVLKTIKTNIALACQKADFLAKSTLQSVQALLIFATAVEMERGMVGTKVWNCLGLAIRQAQDLGLHRETDTPLEKQTDPHHVEMRRRIWGGCITADRWVSALYGLPMMIDISDCDRIYPSVYEYVPGAVADQVDWSHKPFLGNASMIDLSLIFGQVLKLLYTPSGISGVKDEQLHEMQATIDKWLENLQPEVKFDDPSSCSIMSGVLHLAYIPVRFLSLRPFMRLSYAPENVNFYATLAQFTDLALRSRKAIDWVDRNEHVLEGWIFMPYSLFICALIQYHLNVRRRDAISLASLRQARDVLKRVHNEECICRFRIYEIVSILEHTAVSLLNNPPPENYQTRAGMNPTHGSRIRDRDPQPQWDSDRQVFHSGRPTNPNEPPVPSAVMINEKESTGKGDGASPPAFERTANDSADPFFFSDDPNAIFTFAPGSDFVAPGPNDGPLAFDVPDFVADPTQFNSFLQSFGASPNKDNEFSTNNYSW